MKAETYNSNIESINSSKKSNYIINHKLITSENKKPVVVKQTINQNIERSKTPSINRGNILSQEPIKKQLQPKRNLYSDHSNRNIKVELIKK